MFNCHDNFTMQKRFHIHMQNILLLFIHCHECSNQSIICMYNYIILPHNWTHNTNSHMISTSCIMLMRMERMRMTQKTHTYTEDCDAGFS